MTDDPYRRAVPSEEPPPDPGEPWKLQTWESKLSCPRCDRGLFAARMNNIRVDACGGCGGCWLASDDARRMLDEHSRVAADLAHRAGEHARVVGFKPGAIACPECKRELGRTVVPPKQIEIDVCDQHGTWFDRCELEAVVDTLVPKPAPAPVALPVRVSPVAPPSAYDIAREIQRQRQNQEIGRAVFDALAWFVKN